MKTMKASLMVETAYIMPVIFLSFLIGVYMLFYFHDKNILLGAGYETAVVGSEKVKWSEENIEKKMETFFRERVRGKMIFFSMPKVTVKCEKDKFSVVAFARKGKNAFEYQARANGNNAGEVYKKRKGKFMETKYKQDWNHMYFILERPEFYEEDYQMKMMKENKIEGLLQVSGQGINGKSQYSYEISGKVSMKSVYEKMAIEKEELTNFLQQFLNLLSQIENYLLSANCILLQPEYIFYEDGKYFFCYLPIEEEQFCYSFHCLTEYFVSKINHKEQSAILLAYELHKATMEENYSLEKIVGKAITVSENEIRTEKIKEEEYEDDWIDFDEEEEKKGNVLEEKWRLWKEKVGRKKAGKWGEWEKE